MRSVLFVTRHNNDLERAVALAEYLSDFYKVTIVHAESRSTIKDRVLLKLTAAGSYAFLGWEEYFCLGKISYFFRSSPRLVFFARLFSFLNRKFVKDIGPRILLRTKAEIVFFDYIIQDHSLHHLSQLHTGAKRLGIPIVLWAHGLNTMFDLNEVKKGQLIYGDILASPNSFDMAEQYLPAIRFNYKKKVILGDPRYSLSFLTKLAEKNIGRTSGKIIIFGGNFHHIGWDFSQNDQLIIDIINSLRAAGRDENIMVKFHPRVQSSNRREVVAMMPNVKVVGVETNSAELICNGNIVITPPTSVIYEAALLGIPTIIIDPFSKEFVRVYDKIGFSIVTLENFKGLAKLIGKQKSEYNLKELAEITNGGENLENDCRQRFKEMIENVLG